MAIFSTAFVASMLAVEETAMIATAVTPTLEPVVNRAEAVNEHLQGEPRSKGER